MAGFFPLLDHLHAYVFPGQDNGLQGVGQLVDVEDVYSLELFPPGKAPAVETEYPALDDREAWGQVLSQDFRNMPDVTAGLHSRGFGGHWLNREQEMTVHNAHLAADGYLFGD